MVEYNAYDSTISAWSVSMILSRRCRVFISCSFVVTVVFFVSCSSDDNPVGSKPSWQWSTLGEGITGRVFAMTEYDGRLIVGGLFDSAGGIAAHNIAAWNDTVWSTLGTGVNGEVAALTIHEGQLIAGGSFTTAGGVAASNLAVWDGSSWSDVEGGTNGKVYALCSHFTGAADWLLVGGDFTQTGSITVRNLGFHFDSHWGQGVALFDEPVLAFSSDSSNSTTYIGGKFKLVQVPTYGIAVVYRNAWTIFDEGVKASDSAGTVFAIAVHRGKVFFGGLFDEIGGVPALNIGSNTGYSGPSLGEWDSCGSGTSGGPYTSPVQALTSFDNKLIAGGYFRKAGGVTTNNVASWNGTSWSTLGSGVDGDYWPHVWALTTYNGRLIAGGRFTTAGGDSANNIAAWGPK